jgi:ABC-2 type transport system permease protein
MPFKISLFKNEMLKHSGRSAGWISLIYLMVLLFCFPLNILMTATNEDRQFWRLDNLFYYNMEVQTILSIAMPVLLAIFLFRFLNVKESSDLFHSLPVKREHIFHQYTLTGLVLLIVPVLITGVLIFIEHRAFELEAYFSVQDIFFWVGITILLNVIIFMGTVFTGMFTGISFVQGVFSYILLLLPSGLILLWTYNMRFFLYGFPEDYFMDSKVVYFSPLLITQKLPHTTTDPSIFWGYGIISVLMYVVALFVYKKRKAEAVSHAIVFPILKPVFTFGTMLCTAFLAGLYFGETQGNSTPWLIFGYIAGSLTGYLAAEMVLNKTWRVFGSLKKYLLYAGGMLIVLLGLQFDVMQYEDKVPELEDIERVHLSNTPYLYYVDSFRENTFYLKGEENITNIQQLHKAIIANKEDAEQLPRYNVETAFFAYELKNGKKLIREYLIDKNKYKPLYKSIHESEEYKLVANEIYHQKTENVKLITIHPNGPVDRRATFSDPEDIREFISIVKDEISSASYEEMNDTKGFQSHISVLLNNNRSIDLTYKPSYHKLEKWLKEKDAAEDATVSENDISYAVIIKKDQLSKEEQQHFFDMDPGKFFSERTNNVKITNKADIKKAMDQSKDQSILDPEVQYIVAFYFNNDNLIIRCY